MIRLLVVDDHEMIRFGVCGLMAGREDVEVVGEAASVSEAQDAIDALLPDVVVLDLSLPRKGEGLELMADVRQRLAEPPRFLVFSAHDDVTEVATVIAAGAAGFVSKASMHSDLMTAIDTVARGERYVSAEVIGLLAAGFRADGQPLTSPTAKLDSLSARERQVFERIATGDPLTDIARELKVSVKTVSTYRRRILDKLELQSNAELTRYSLLN